MFASLRQRMRVGTRAANEIASLAPATEVKIVGKVGESATQLSAPITGRNCAFYSVRIGEWFNGAKTPLLEEKSAPAFPLTDASGTTQIVPSAAEAFLRQHRKRGHSSDTRSEHRSLLARDGYGMTDEYGELRSLAYEEFVVLPGDTICVIGTATATTDSAGGFRGVHGVQVQALRIVHL